MKFIISLILSITTVISFGQIQPGFEKQEARDMIALCNSFTFMELYNSDSKIIPAHYEKVYTSGIFGMDNKFQIYRKGKVAVINLRGSTDDMSSWLENMYASMIPANGTIKTAGETFAYSFAKDTSAAVHAGYALGIVYLSNDIKYHINNLNRDGIYAFIITGHSQGGSLAIMLRAYLENLPEGVISPKNKFKTYAFAHPMVGDKEFSAEYNKRFCINETGYSVVNPKDLVPKFPLAYNDENYVADNLMKLFDDKESFDPRRLALEGVLNRFESFIGKSMQYMGNSISEQLKRELGHVEMPAFVKEINYSKIENRVEIPPVEYPLILKDPTILKNDSLMAVLPRDDKGNFTDRNLYEKEGIFYQHKPYNYYVSLLKTFFPKDYDALELKFLPENLR
jgi:hypothetical protein